MTDARDSGRAQRLFEPVKRWVFGSPHASMSERVARRALASIVFTLALAWTDPFGLPTVTDRQSQAVLNAFMAPLYPEPFHPEEKRDRITVVLATDKTLDALDRHWPLSHQAQARLIETILRHEPDALFLDYLFTGTRDQDGTAALRDAVTGRSTPILFSESPSADQPNLLAKWHSNAPDSSLRPVSVFDTVPSDHKLLYDLVESRSSPRAPPPPPSPAFALYQEHCRQSGECAPVRCDYRRPLEVIWGSDLPRYPVPGGAPSTNGFIDCKEDVPDDVLGRLGKLLTSGTAAIQRQCPYIETLPAHALWLQPWSDEVRALLNDRLVVFGGSFDAAADLVHSPTHGPIPGAHLHAMALHNLLVWGREYVSPEHAYGAPVVTPVVAESVAVLLSHLLGPLAFLGTLRGLKRTPVTDAHDASNQADRRYGFWIKVFGFLAGLACVLVVVTGVIAVEWAVFRLSTVNWIGILGVSGAYLTLYTQLTAAPNAWNDASQREEEPR